VMVARDSLAIEAMTAMFASFFHFPHDLGCESSSFDSSIN
jgi:hypothetical protein